MRIPAHRARRLQPAFCAAAAALLFLVAGCGGLDKQSAPDLSGPSDAGISVELTALPDTVNADGVSQSVIRLVLRDEMGRPVSGRSVLFEHDGDGYLTPSSASTFVGPVQTGLVMATDRDGVAYVVYVAGTHTGAVTFAVRPYGIDTALTFFRSVQLFQV
jgi:hypothetical protein